MGDFLWRHGDAMFVVIIAFGVAILEAFGVPSEGVIDAAILATLGTVAIVLFRDRLERGSLASIEQLANDAISDRPYEVVWQKNHWDIIDRDHVNVRATEQLRFTRPDVSTIAHWSQGDGRVISKRGRWRRSRNHSWIDARQLGDEFGVQRGGCKAIFCFDREHNRGDIVEWTLEREIEGRFPSTTENVGFTARARSDYPRVMRITWPADSPPTSVTIQYGHNQPSREIPIKRKDGRPYVEEKVPGLGIGETVDITWNW